MYNTNNNKFLLKLLSSTLLLLTVTVTIQAKLVKYNYEKKDFKIKNYIITDKGQDFIIYKNNKYIDLEDKNSPIHLYSIDKKLKQGSYYFIKNISIVFPNEQNVKFNFENTLATYIIDTLGYKDITKIGIDKTRLIIKNNLSNLLKQIKTDNKKYIIRTNLSTYYIDNRLRKLLLPIILKTGEDIQSFKSDIEVFNKQKKELDILTPLNLNIYRNK